jgi:cytochrome c biogenesis protein CcdA
MYILISIAFTAGILSFLSPCSVGMIPAYVGFYISNNEDRSFKKIYLGVLKGFVLALGFSTIFILFAIFIIAFGDIVINIVPWIVIIIGVIIIVMGVLSLLNKGVNLNIFHKIESSLENKAKNRNGILKVYLFGILYGLASLGCSFPLFISTVLSTFIDKNYLNTVFVAGAYLFGIFIVSIILSSILSVSNTFIQDRFFKYRQYINKIAGIIMIIAGIYIIYYQASAYFSFIKIL